METQLVAEFVSKTGSSPDDALSCLKTWGWDLKKALIDYNGKDTKQKAREIAITNGNGIDSFVTNAIGSYCRYIDNRVL